MKRLLITGANGYIGARLSKLFSINRYSVTGICYPTIPNDLIWQKHFTKLYNFDLRESEVIDQISDDYYDILINLVSLDQFQSEGDANIVTSVNITPTFNLLKNFSKKKTLKKFIYFSTVQVYGKLPMENITENHVPIPKNIYGLTHFLTEQICEFYNNNSDITCINVRLSNSYGSPVLENNNCWGLAVNDFCRMAFYKNKIELKSDGFPLRDFIHGDDIFNALKILINSDLEENSVNVFHISSSKTITMLELAHLVSKIFQKNLNVVIPVILSNGSVSKDTSHIPIKKYNIDNSKIKELGFKQQINIINGIQELFNYFSK